MYGLEDELLWKEKSLHRGIQSTLGKTEHLRSNPDSSLVKHFYGNLVTLSDFLQAVSLGVAVLSTYAQNVFLRNDAVL